MKLEKETIGLAGEYAVASEFCKRGFYAQLTLGHHKKTDLLLEGSGRLFRASVKSKQGNEWPNVRGIWEEDDLIVLVDFKDKKLLDRPDYFVLTVADWKKVTKKLIKRKAQGVKIDETNTLYWDPSKGYPKGWRGCSVSVEDVREYKDCWPKAS
jgi:hypothetical protein